MPPAPTLEQAPRGASKAALWGRAVLVVLTIGAAHLGLFLLLAGPWRGEMSRIEAEFGDRLAGARDPGTRPLEHAASLEWLRKERVWEASRKHAKLEGYVSLLGFSLLGSFLVQAIVIGVLLYRSAHRRGRITSPTPTPRRG